MSLRNLTLGCVLLGSLLLTTHSMFAQAAGADRRGDFNITAIRQFQVDAPNYGAASSDLGGRPSTLWRKWLKIEVQFSSKQDWADDVQVKYYVLVGKPGEEKLFVGDVTHINIAKGSQHYSAIFMHPNTLRRYGAGQIIAVAVRIFHQGRVVDSLSEPAGREGWWEKYSPVPGYLLAPQDTPWAPIADERFEEIKPTTRQ